MFISKYIENSHFILHLYIILLQQVHRISTHTHKLETTLSLTSSNFRFIFGYFPCLTSCNGFSTKTLETTLSHVEKLYSLTIK